MTILTREGKIYGYATSQTSRRRRANIIALQYQLSPSLTTTLTMRDNLDLLKAFLLDHPGVQHVQMHLNDYSNITKCQSVPLRRAFQLAAIGGGYKTRGSNLFCRDRFGAPVPRGPEEDDGVTMLIDWSTITSSAADPAVAYVLVKLHTPRFSNPFAYCPRSILQSLVKTAELKHGIQIEMGWEIEFCLLEFLEPPVGVVSTGERHPSYCVVKDAVAHLEANDIGVWVHHIEADATTPASFEISLEPATPLQAADNVLYGLCTIKDMAEKHGYTATFHPVPFDTFPSAGQHIHLSISKIELADHFLAGMMGRLPDTTAFFSAGTTRTLRSDHGTVAMGWHTGVQTSMPRSDIAVLLIGSSGSRISCAIPTFKLLRSSLLD